MTGLAIPPRRSMTLYALLAIVMGVLSYIVVMLLAAACVYLPYELVVSANAISQSVLLLLFGLVLAGGLLWSLIPRRDKFVAPGLLLERSLHPALFAEIDSIAGALNQPVPKEVYLIGEVNAWVADRGGIVGLGSRRVMALGLPLMSVMSVAQFRAVLAHEFAHYYGGDTSLGPWVYKTKMAMLRSFQTIGSLSQLARHWVLAIMTMVVSTILKWYFLGFMRAMNFVSRKQEFRADELACLVAGPKSLIDGLRAIAGTSGAWQVYWNSEVLPVLNNGCRPALGSGFAQFVSAPGIAPRVQEAIETQIREGKTGAYDTHPPLRLRIAAAEVLPGVSGTEDARPASCLLENPELVEQALLQALNPDLPAGKLRYVTWDEVGPMVTIPAWRKVAEQYGAKFKAFRVAEILELVPKLAEIGASIPDPKGMLLTPQQRTGRAAQLLAIGVGLALLDSGWELRLQPGVFQFWRGEMEFNPFSAVDELMNGKMSREAWSSRCGELGVGECVLFGEKGSGVGV